MSEEVGDFKRSTVMSRLKWNMPELHSAQPLDYLSQFYLECYTNTCYSG